MDAGKQQHDQEETRVAAVPGPQDYSFLDRGVPVLFERLTDLAVAATGCSCAWIGWPDGQELRLSCRTGLNVSSVFLKSSHSCDVLADGRPWISCDRDQIDWDLESQRDIRFLGVWPVQPVEDSVAATFSVAGAGEPDGGAQGLQVLAQMAELVGVLMEVERLRRTRRGNRAAWSRLWLTADDELAELVAAVQDPDCRLSAIVQRLAGLTERLAEQALNPLGMPVSDYRSRSADLQLIGRRFSRIAKQLQVISQALPDRVAASANA